MISRAAFNNIILIEIWVFFEFLRSHINVQGTHIHIYTSYYKFHHSGMMVESTCSSILNRSHGGVIDPILSKEQWSVNLFFWSNSQICWDTVISFTNVYHLYNLHHRDKYLMFFFLFEKSILIEFVYPYPRICLQGSNEYVLKIRFRSLWPPSPNWSVYWEVEKYLFFETQRKRPSRFIIKETQQKSNLVKSIRKVPSDWNPRISEILVF